MIIVGHERQVNILDTHIRRDTISHAYLFSGMSHVGKATIARMFVASLLCEKRPAGILASCGLCRTCRAIENKNHPDIFTVSSMTEERSRDYISLDAIRNMRKHMGRTALLGAYNIAFIDDASFLGREAANAFLKILEDPPEKTIFILITTSKDTILPTIFSRVWHMAFWPVSASAIERYSMHEYGWSEEKARSVGAYAYGRPGMVCLFHENNIAMAEGEKRKNEHAARHTTPLSRQFSAVEDRIKHDGMHDAWYTDSIGPLVRALEECLCGRSYTGVSARRVAAWIRNELAEQTDLKLPYIQKKMRMEANILTNYTL
ncbi:MAG: hypothetical protein COU90_04485 [Candidatus Ryanbacteria bacterium CG10_big_fil_rev_8_21_14_0_10_43_42]|uniref:DNA polymerase III subunit delta n=1 Tax=Candidatus Ryanbacteria bacterium CG10_big_fil_rev_8_21_14_0_10_43_42 TaxID=1974864 RepID=A0A2M8KW22_9BACT|nr:MAG: hypothetical protein COU90_04485 [Candidatus Ryanbacteria bacterium CG10_big_fil_rev_8_21_14_0_10_43_42]